MAAAASVLWQQQKAGTSRQSTERLAPAIAYRFCCYSPSCAFSAAQAVAFKLLFALLLNAKVDLVWRTR